MQRLTLNQNIKANSNCLTFSMLWTPMSPHYVIPLCATGDICCPAVCYLCVISDLCHPKRISLNFAVVWHWKSAEFPMISPEIKARMKLYHPQFKQNEQSFCEVIIFVENALLQAIWEQIWSSMHLGWNCILFYQLLIMKYQWVKKYRCTVIPNGWYR